MGFGGPADAAGAVALRLPPLGPAPLPLGAAQDRGGAGEWEGYGGYFAPKAALRAAAALTHAGAGWGRTRALEQPRSRADDGKHHSDALGGSRESRELN